MQLLGLYLRACTHSQKHPMCTNTLCLLLCKLTESHPMREIVPLCRKERRPVEEFGSSCDYEIDQLNSVAAAVILGLEAPKKMWV